MKGAVVKIARIAGVQVNLEPSLIVFLSMRLVLGFLAGDYKGGFLELGKMLALYVCVLIHEFGHILAGRRVGVNSKEVSLFIFGGAAHLEESPKGSRQEFVLAIAGPLTSVALAGVLFLISPLTGPLAKEVTALALINLGLAAFNLLPLFPLDGGRVFRSLLVRKLERVKATWIAVRTSQVLASTLAIGAAIYLKNIWVVLVAGFVIMAAQAEGRGVEREENKPKEPAVLRELYDWDDDILEDRIAR